MVFLVQQNAHIRIDIKNFVLEIFFFVKDEERSGRPTEVDDDQIKVLIEDDLQITV